VPDVMIELDLSTPWEPQELAKPRRRRWLAVVVVAVLTAGLLVSAGPRPPTGPVFTLDFQVLSIGAAGGRVIATRYRPAGVGAELEAVRLRDGAPLWSRVIDLTQHLTYVTDRVVVLMTESDDQNGPANTLTAIDAATGAIRWERHAVRLVGSTADRILVEDVTGVLEEFSYTEFDNPAVNQPAEQRDKRFLGLDQATGTAAWELRVPKGTITSVSWTGGDGELTAFKELTPTGLLRERDLRTGAVTATHQLDWSGPVANYTTGADQVVIYRAGERGADVYNRTTGRPLWHWPGDGQRWDMLYACLPDRYCTSDGTGLTTLDARTGRPAWHIDRYDSVLRAGPDSIVVAAFLRTDPAPAEIAVVDARTGAIRQRVVDWHVVQTFTGGRTIVWRPLNVRDALVGIVDRRSGRVGVLGRAPDWYGQPDCVVDGDMLACVAVGTLSAWRLP